jgi:hypothetical protein
MFACRRGFGAVNMFACRRGFGAVNMFACRRGFGAVNMFALSSWLWCCEWHVCLSPRLCRLMCGEALPRRQHYLSMGLCPSFGLCPQGLMKGTA